MKIAVLTGAGISAESGIGTFRDNGGLWEKYKIEDVATPEAWENNPTLVLNFYNERRKQVISAKPNNAHFALAKLEEFHDTTVITQNIDDLHERAGTKNIIHLHGEILKAKSSELSTDYYHVSKDVTIGDKCNKGYQLRPHVVWFGESVPEMEIAEKIVNQSDLIIIIGTSLNVYPAAGLVNNRNSKAKVILIDNNPDFDKLPSYIEVITDRAGIAVPHLVEKLTQKKEEL
jgi:NAD-dependent deacetylase